MEGRSRAAPEAEGPNPTSSLRAAEAAANGVEFRCEWYEKLFWFVEEEAN